MDIEKLLEKSISQNLSPAVFAQVDESDMVTAPNILDFCLDKKFLNVQPYPRQIQMMLALYEDYCVACSDPDLVKNMHKEAVVEILDRVQLLHYGVCPKCKRNRNDFIKDGSYTAPYELDAAVGQRSGKSLLVAMCSNYTLHRFLRLGSPSHYFNLLPTTLHGTFTALSHQQAEETLFQPFIDIMDSSPWYKQYFELLDYYGKKIGEELYQVGAFVYFKGAQLTVYPKGPDKRMMRGRTRFLYAIDEIGWFSGDDTAIKMSADEIDHALSRSMTTVRQANAYKRIELGEYDIPQAMSFNVSSPAHANDKIMRLVRQGQKDPTKVVFHYPTWLAHPKITRASLEPEFKRDEVAAERDYGANPPIADSPLISNVEKIKECFKDKPQSNLVTIKVGRGWDANKNDFCYPEIKLHASDKRTPYILTLDAGHTNNSFAVALSHWEAGNIHHDILIEARPHHDMYVNFNKVFDYTIAPLFNNFNIDLIVADRWQGLKVLHDASEKYDCKFKQYSMTYDNFVEYKNLVLDGRVYLPKPEQPIDVLFNTSEAYEDLTLNRPVLHLGLQMLTVKEVGRQITKGDGGLTDDLFRATALAGTFLLHDDYKYLRVKGEGGMKSTRVLGTVRKLGSMGYQESTARTSRIGGVQRRGIRR